MLREYPDQSSVLPLFDHNFETPFNLSDSLMLSANDADP